MSSLNGFHAQVGNWHAEKMASLEGMVEEMDGYPYEKRQLNDTHKILKKIELDVAYSLEKVQNLEILLIHVASIAGDFEALAIENKDLVADSEEKVFEFDLLSCILDSETEELNLFVNSIQEEILNIRENNSDDVFSEFRFKLDESEEALSQTQDQLLEMRMLAAKFKRTLCFIGQETGNNGSLEHKDKYRCADAMEKLQPYDQQRHILKMLENSLARDIDLERKLSATRHSEEELKFRLRYAEQELLLTERTIEKLSQKTFEAENMSEMLSGNLAEVVGKQQLLQLQLNSALRREAEVQAVLLEAQKRLSDKENALKEQTVRCKELDNKLALQCRELGEKLKEAEDRYGLANSEVASLKEKLNSTEQLLQDSDTRSGVAAATEGKYTLPCESKHKLNEELECLRDRACLLESTEEQLHDSEALVRELNSKVLAAEHRANDAEAKYALMFESKQKLDEEFECLKDKVRFLESSLHEFENDNLEAKLKLAEDRCSLTQSEVITLEKKLKSLEEKLRDTEVRFQNAVASAEATDNEKDILNKRVSEMDELVRDLKTNALEAERRAKESETRCALLSENNLELNEELEYLKDRIDCLEASLNQSEREKIAAAKEISARSNIITDMINQLAIERQHLQLQISALVQENALLASKHWQNDSPVILGELECEKKLAKEIDAIGVDATHAAATMETYVESEPRSLYEQVKVDELSDVTRGPLCKTLNASACHEVDSSTTAMVRTIEAAQLSRKYIVAFFVVFIAIILMYLLQQERCPF